MLLRGDAALIEAYQTSRAIPGFVVYNLEMVQAVVDAAEATDRPVLLMAGSSAFRHAGRHPLALLALEAAEATSGSIGVHLDHCRSLEELEFCLELGYSSVMIDGAHLPFDDNVGLTKAAVERAHAVGAWVEGELVTVAGDEDRSTDASSDALTDPEQARQFVGATGVDALAVAVGNVHGRTQRVPVIDLARLSALREAVRLPLVLHGASGLSDEIVLACVRRGVAKMNVNAELRRSFLEALTTALPGALPTDDLTGALAIARRAVAQRATAITRLLAGE